MKDIETVTTRDKLSVKDETVFRHCQQRKIVKREIEPPLPIPFELPRNFPAIVMCELEKGTLSSKGKTKLIGSVAAAMFRFKSYPTRREYEHVGELLIEKYSFLRSSSGSGYVSVVCVLLAVTFILYILDNVLTCPLSVWCALYNVKWHVNCFQGYLKEALQDKLKYLRNAGKPKKRQSTGNEASPEPVAKKVKPEFKQFPQLSLEPPLPPEEDEASYSRNNKLLLSEEKRVNPNKNTISVLMERTYAFRRREILKTTVPVHEILTLFPSLKRLDQVKLERIYCIHTIVIIM